MQSRTLVILSSATAGLLGVGAVGYLALDGSEQQVAPMQLMSSTSGSTSEAGEEQSSERSGPPAQPVDGSEQLVGELRADDDDRDDDDDDGERDDDADDWSVSGVEVGFGPEEWLRTDPELEDFDGNGSVEPVLDELRGLEGTEVTLSVRYEDDDEADVFAINGMSFRGTEEGSAPWQSSGEQSEADRETVSENAVAAVGEGATIEELEREDDDGWEGWEAEVRSADGQEHEVLLDLAGEVVHVDADSDSDD